MRSIRIDLKEPKNSGAQCTIAFFFFKGTKNIVVYDLLPLVCFINKFFY